MWSVFSVTYFDNHDQNTLSVNFDEHFKESHEVISFTLSHLNNSLLHSRFYFTISNSLRSRCELLIGDPRGGGATYNPPPPWSKFFHFHAVSVADPGFPRGGGANSPEGKEILKILNTLLNANIMFSVVHKVGYIGIFV